MIEAVFFDFDGLILDTEYPEYVSWKEIFEAHGLLLSPQLWAQHTGKGTGAIDYSPYDDLEERLGHSIDRDSIRMSRRQHFAELIAGESLLPGVESRMEEAQQLGWKIGLVSSSSREWVMGHLSRFGLTAAFDVILCREDVIHTKPHPELYLKALSLLGLKADQAIALEDSANGTASAKAAGLSCVAVPNRLTSHTDLQHSDWIIPSLADVTLQELQQRAEQQRRNTISSAKTIKGILFDLDNTLYDRDLAFEKWAGEFVKEQFAAENEALRAAILQQIIAIDAHGYVTKHVLFTQVKALYPTITHEVEELCERFYQEWLVHMALDDETLSLLDALDEAGIPFGIITNGPSQQHLKIDQLALRSRTRCLFVSAEFGCNKPDPSIFLAAASCLGIPCEDILFVGDNPIADICGAHNVGMTTAWLNRGAEWPETIVDVQPDYVIKSLAELTTIPPLLKDGTHF